jgi:hypothetical protein
MRPQFENVGGIRLRPTEVVAYFRIKDLSTYKVSIALSSGQTIVTKGGDEEDSQLEIEKLDRIMDNLK